MILRPTRYRPPFRRRGVCDFSPALIGSIAANRRRFSGGGGGGGGGTPPPTPEDDLYFQNVVFLAGNDSKADGTTAIDDQSTLNNTITANGNAQYDTAQAPSGLTSSILCDGSGDFLSATDNTSYDMGSGDFTMECYVRLNSLGGHNGLFVKRTNASVFAPFHFWINQTTGRLGMLASTDGSSWGLNIAQASGGLSTGQWYHVAFQRHGSRWSGFVDGVEVVTGTLSGAVMTNATAMVVGALGTDGNSPLNGWIAGIRITKGVARYTGSPPTFTRPTLPLAAVDHLWSSVIALLPFDILSPQDFRDFATGENWAGSGHAAVSTAQSKFGGSALVMDGTDDRITSPSHARYALGSGDFCMEGWTRATNPQVQATPTVLQNNGSWPTDTWAVNANHASTPNHISIWIGNWNNVAAVLTGSTEIRDSAWHHWGLSRNGNTFRLFVDGVLEDSDTFAGSVDSAAAPALIVSGSGVNAFTGYEDDVRVTKGAARYTTAFPVPAAPFYHS